MRGLAPEDYDLRMPILKRKLQTTWDEKEARAAALARLPSGASRPEAITPASPHVFRRSVWTCARYFRREFGYDSVQYGYEGREHDPNSRAFLWFANEHSYRSTVIGACCFRWREFSNIPHCWALQWVWLHPYERREGHLLDYWPYFRARFGDFLPEGPVSPAMLSFLEKHAPWLDLDRKNPIQKGVVIQERPLS